MKHWDVIVIGAGIIGLALAIELNKRGLRVLIVDKGEPGREASWAAGGMLADFPLEMPLALRDLAAASARMYPEFVHELEDGSRLKIDLRDEGALVFIDHPIDPALDRPINAAPAVSNSLSAVSQRSLAQLEPNLSTSKLSTLIALHLAERSIDPRHLTAAAVAAAKHRGIDFSSGNQVLAVEVADGKATGVRTSKTRFGAATVVNCAGAWAGQIGPYNFPTRPVKGQMLCVVMPQKEMVRHVIRTPSVYLIPRTDGRMLIGATQEEAGFDKQTVPETIQELHRSAIDLVPKLAEARILEAWAGLRPGTPDALPILGATETPGYFVATGHFRDGILLAPVTAQVMAQVIAREKSEFDLKTFRPGRF
ncbi:MAG: glycine oxidase ThiO [Terriglobales bacterium]